MSEFGGEADDIYSKRVFRILSPNGHGVVPPGHAFISLPRERFSENREAAYCEQSCVSAS